jgi:hypothetical protein
VAGLFGRVEQQQGRLAPDFPVVGDDVELVFLVAVDRVDQLAGETVIGLFQVDPHAHHQRDQPQDESGWNDQP